MITMYEKSCSVSSACLLYAHGVDSNFLSVLGGPKLFREEGSSLDKYWLKKNPKLLQSKIRWYRRKDSLWSKGENNRNFIKIYCLVWEFFTFPVLRQKA